MNTASLYATGDLARELHALLRETDPARWSDTVAQRARLRWERIKHGVEQCAANFEQSPGLGDALAHVAVLVRESTIGDHDEQPQKSQWMELRARLMPAYERLAAQLRARSLRAPTLRPTNWARIGFHVSSALGALLLLELVLTRSGTLLATLAFAASCWFLEIGRALSARMNDRLMKVRFFQLIIHPHEHHKVNSATWYGTALFTLAIFSSPLASACALAVLGLGDPIAGLVGRRWGRHPVGGGRTLEGSVAFALGGTLAALAVLLGWHAVAGWPLLLVVAAAAAVAGAAAEAFSRKIDDNLAVPLAAALAASLAAWVAGVPL